MLRDHDQEQVIHEILSKPRRYALYGMSSNPIRPSHFVGTYLAGHGFDFVSVNPGLTELFGRPAVARLSQVPGGLGVVVVFRKVEECPAVVKEALENGAKYIWLQYGLVSPESRELCRLAGVPYVDDRCLKVEHCRYVGNLFQAGVNTGLVSAARRKTHSAELTEGLSVAPVCQIPARPRATGVHP